MQALEQSIGQRSRNSENRVSYAGMFYALLRKVEKEHLCRLLSSEGDHRLVLYCSPVPSAHIKLSEPNPAFNHMEPGPPALP